MFVIVYPPGSVAGGVFPGSVSSLKGVASPIEDPFGVLQQQRPHMISECSGEGDAPGVLLWEI